jgi:S-adenosylmethionine decarboxylase
VGFPDVSDPGEIWSFESGAGFAARQGGEPVDTVGTHFVLELYECPSGLLDDRIFVRDVIRKAADAAGSTLLNEVQHKFEPQGVTALGLLAESHISVHTWPEGGYAAADVFTCGAHTLPDKACELLIQLFQARRYAMKAIPRGTVLGESQAVPVAADGCGELTEEADEAFKCRVQNFARISG